MLSLNLISNAYADAGAAPQGGFMDFLPLVALLVFFYFMILRPQQKRAKEHKALMDALQRNDEVLTTSGILGRVAKVGEDYVSVEIAENVVVQVQKAAIQNVLPKGTLKSAN
jgi:preprotein translocase subunit YajC